MKLLSIAFALALTTLSATAQTNGSSTIIREQPAGILHDNYARSSYYFYTSQSSTTGVYYGIDLWSTSRYVEGDDGCVYLYNPFCQLPTRSWLKLDPAGDGKFVAHLPQAIREGVGYDENGNEVTTLYYAFPVKEYEREDGTLFCKADTLADGTVRSELNFVLRNDSLIQLDDVYMGLVNDKLQWAGYGDGEIVINKITVPKYEPTAEQIKRAQLYIMRTGDADSTRDWQVVKTVKDGNDIYVCNPYNNSDSQWMKGSLQGNMLHFDGNQYLGIDSTYMIHLYSRAAHYTLHEESDPVWGTNTSYYTFSFAPALDMPYNTAAGGYGVGDAAADTLAWLINAGNTVPFFVSSYIRPLFSPYADEASGPQAPQFQANQCKPYTTEEGYGYITFSYSKFDKKGHFLNPSKYFYRVFTLLTDDPMEPPHEFVFKADTYGSLKNDATQIPVQYADRSDFFTMNGSKDGEPTKASQYLQYGTIESFDVV